MQWDDIGYLISKNKYNENSIITEIFTENHGKCSGIIFGASSKKIKNTKKLYLMTTNKKLFYSQFDFKEVISQNLLIREI